MDCDECKKDWTKCATCPVMKQWMNEHKKTEKTGKWIIHENNQTQMFVDYIECDCCNSWFVSEHLVRRSYCPNCGAKMQVESEE